MSHAGRISPVATSPASAGRRVTDGAIALVISVVIALGVALVLLPAGSGAENHSNATDGRGSHVAGKFSPRSLPAVPTAPTRGSAAAIPERYLPRYDPPYGVQRSTSSVPCARQ